MYVSHPTLNLLLSTNAEVFIPWVYSFFRLTALLLHSRTPMYYRLRSRCTPFFSPRIFFSLEATLKNLTFNLTDRIGFSFLIFSTDTKCFAVIWMCCSPDAVSLRSLQWYYHYYYFINTFEDSLLWIMNVSRIVIGLNEENKSNLNYSF